MQFGFLCATMIIRVLWFNIYLLFLALALGGGCKSDKSNYSKRDQASLRLYIEVNPDGSSGNETVLIGRQEPFALNVEKKAFLTEFNIEKACVVDTLGGFSISLRFDKEGSWLLEQYTTAYKG